MYLLADKKYWTVHTPWLWRSSNGYTLASHGGDPASITSNFKVRFVRASGSGEGSTPSSSVFPPNHHSTTTPYLSTTAPRGVPCILNQTTHYHTLGRQWLHLWPGTWLVSEWRQFCSRMPRASSRLEIQSTQSCGMLLLASELFKLLFFAFL
jgi:hypothetical protein